jgi:Helix-turn-helix domain
MLLVETDYHISMVAAETGFSNLSNFNRQFRNARHMTPKEFRRFVVKYGRLPDVQPEIDLTKRSPSLEQRAKSRFQNPLLELVLLAFRLAAKKRRNESQLEQIRLCQPGNEARLGASFHSELTAQSQRLIS